MRQAGYCMSSCSQLLLQLLARGAVRVPGQLDGVSGGGGRVRPVLVRLLLIRWRVVAVGARSDARPGAAERIRKTVSEVRIRGPSG